MLNGGFVRVAVSVIDRHREDRLRAYARRAPRAARRARTLYSPTRCVPYRCGYKRSARHGTQESDLSRGEESISGGLSARRERASKAVGDRGTRARGRGLPTAGALPSRHSLGSRRRSPVGGTSSARATRCEAPRPSARCGRRRVAARGCRARAEAASSPSQRARARAPPGSGSRIARGCSRHAAR
jgi:hypothetical protein